MVAAMANVTIYGSECPFVEFCDEDFNTLDDLLRHVVNEHDETWDYDKMYEEVLDRIGEGIIQVEDVCERQEDEDIKCESCGKYFVKLDTLMVHVMLDHTEVFDRMRRNGGLYLNPDFLR